MKVDVILRQAFMDDLRSVVNDGQVSADSFLTARFDIPDVNITSQAFQKGEPRDLFTERLDLDRPVQFKQDGEVVHRLRPVRTQLLNDAGVPVHGEGRSVQTAQTWQL